ncbi:MAG: cysteine protease StiP domain-containing protein [Pseudomonadota bacterium]
MPAVSPQCVAGRPQAGAPFSGSYAPEDVTFLLRPVPLEAVGPGPADTADKERQIQTGRRHYSEMIVPEAVPGPAYMAVFEAALARYTPRMAAECAALVGALAAAVAGPITLASLVRAGVPLGVLLARGLRALGRDTWHAGISIIRDRGLDGAALDHLLARRPSGGLVFVDGWTGKGAIADELEADLARRWPAVAPRLAVLADPCGRAWLSASHEDWLIPSGILGGNVSGLVSRSILNDRVVGPGQFHATVVMAHLAPHDATRGFVDTVWDAMAPLLVEARPARVRPERRAAVRAEAKAAIDAVAARFAIRNRNRIKPGIAEATRAVLRRAPERVLVSDPDDPDLAGLMTLARDRGVTVDVAEGQVAPYRCITLIRGMQD